MNPHPIPQNVTSFQFHLVGDMTLKQFLYLAAGCGIGYGLFVFLASYYPYVAWPLITISVISGTAFAFMPIGSRPLDYWLGAFLKAIYSPTKRMWNKNGQVYKENSLFNSRLVMYLSALQARPQGQDTSEPIRSISSPIRAVTPPSGASSSNQNTQKPPTNPTASQSLSEPQIPASLNPTLPSSAAALPTTDDLGKTVDLARQAQNLQIRILQTERALNQIKSEAQQPSAVPVDYSGQVNKIIADLQTLVSQASQTREKLDQLTKPEQEAEIAKPKAKIKVIIPEKEKQTQLALTTFPNVINGIVKDKNGDYLEGAVAVIHDKEGLPVRALKTNKLGQFTGSTPLPNGTYTLELEKDNHTFDVLQIELTGQVLPPIMVTAK